MFRLAAVGLSLCLVALVQAQRPPAGDAPPGPEPREAGRRDKESFRGELVLFGAHRAGQIPDVPCILRMRPDGTGLETVLELKKGESVRAGRVAPDGKRLAFSLLPGKNEKAGIWILEPNQKGEKVADDGFVRAWSPDGTRLACYRQSGKDVENFLLDLGTKKEQPLPIPKTDKVEDWSPDGRFLTVLAGNPDKVFKHPNPAGGNYPLRHVYLWDLTQSRRKEFTTGPLQDNLFSSFSPDGKQVAYCQRRYQDRDLFHTARVRAVDGGEAEKEVLSFDKLRAEGQYETFKPSGFPCWSPDGKSLVTLVLGDKWVTRPGGEMVPQIRMEMVFFSLEKGVESRPDLEKLGVASVAFIDWR